jgi:DNA-3-methyladenine glycosylase I
MARCPWAEQTEDLREYHDLEWGRPVRGDDAVFERLVLEGFQSGLSWLTILRKRPAFRAAFAGFAIDAVACFTDADRARLRADAGIVRHGAKIDAAIHNARVAGRLRAERGPGALDALVWAYSADRPRPRTTTQIPAVTAASTALARDLRALGWRFIGPTTAYACMQALGVVDDHLASCPVLVAR